MIPITLHGKGIETVFHLLGSSENAMTMSLGWCLSQVPSFLDRLGGALGTPDLCSHDAVIRLQEHEAGTGITDIEIYAPGYAAWIVEAKRGFVVPSTDQLRQYAERLNRLKDGDATRGLVVLAASDRSGQWLLQRVPDQIDGIPVRALSWRDVQRMAGEAHSLAGRAGKNLLAQFQSYLGSEASMQDQYSNWVYVVSLNHETFGGKTTFVEVVEKHRKYFHPMGGGRGGWPVDPPNYIAFRYDGGLRSIHHVDGHEVVSDLAPFFPNQPSEEWDLHFLYHLGPPIRPAKEIKVGARWRANRVWCFIDTLLTSDTIAEALEKTKEREQSMLSGAAAD